MNAVLTNIFHYEAEYRGNAGTPLRNVHDRFEDAVYERQRESARHHNALLLSNHPVDA